MNANLSSFLNLSRWLAAFLVVVYHVRQQLLADWSRVDEQTVAARALYFLTGLGHEAVIVFFVISGFLVGGMTIDRWRAHGPNLHQFIVARVSRIYTVLIPALISGAALDLLGQSAFDASGVHARAMNGSGMNSLDWPTLVGNLFMLQTIVVDLPGSNTPLWSLANEWWYYCLFALLGATLTASPGRRIGSFAIATILALWLPPGLLLWGLIWGIGVVAYFWAASARMRPRPVVGLAVLLAAMAWSSRHADGLVGTLPVAASFVRDLLLGLAYATALAGISRCEFPPRCARLNARLAEFSFTTYCFHFPAMLFIVAGAAQVLGLPLKAQPSAAGLLACGVTIILVYLYCYAWSLLAERHTQRVRGALLAASRRLRRIVLPT